MLSFELNVINVAPRVKRSNFDAKLSLFDFLLQFRPYYWVLPSDPMEDFRSLTT